MTDFKQLKDCEYIDIPLDKIYDLNQLLKAYSTRRGPQAGWALRTKSRNAVINEVLKQSKSNKLNWTWPNFLLFEWHEPNKRKDPDNVSSAGKKAILDGLQKINLDNDDPNSMLLPNDNNKHIHGFLDIFVFDKQNFVRVYQLGPDFAKNIYNLIDTERVSGFW